jgi:hypothetical protein
MSFIFSNFYNSLEMFEYNQIMALKELIAEGEGDDDQQ